MKYIAQLRLQNALTMLENTGQTVAEVALASGYTDPNYFSRLVRQVTGIAPHQYRLNQMPSSSPRPKPRR